YDDTEADDAAKTGAALGLAPAGPVMPSTVSAIAPTTAHTRRAIVDLRVLISNPPFGYGRLSAGVRRAATSCTAACSGHGPRRTHPFHESHRNRSRPHQAAAANGLASASRRRFVYSSSGCCRTCFVGPLSTTRPAFSTRIRSVMTRALSRS